MGRDVDFTDQGQAIFREGIAGGQEAARINAPATLAASYTLELLDALPAGTEFLTVDASGKIGFSAGASGDLQAAYDSGGPGLGRVIVADNGAVQIDVSAAAGNAALAINQADNFGAVTIAKTGIGVGTVVSVTDAGTGTMLSLVKAGGTGNVLSMSGANSTFLFSDILDVQGTGAGVAVASFLKLDATGDPCVEIFNFSGTGSALKINGTSGLGLEVIGGTSGAIGVTQAGAVIAVSITAGTAAGLSVAQANNNAAVIFTKTATGAGNVLGVTNAGTGDAVAITATLGRAINAQVNSDTVGVLIQKTVTGTQRLVDIVNGGTGIGLIVTNSVTGSGVTFQATTNNTSNPTCRLNNGGNNGSTLYCTQLGGVSTVSVCAEFEQAAGGTCVLIDANGSACTALSIDSEATSRPLIELLPLNANTRGDINFSTARTADPGSPSEADIWYNSTLTRLSLRSNITTHPVTIASRYFGGQMETSGIAISGGVATITRGRAQVTAEGGPGADTLDTLNSTPQAQQGDMVVLSTQSGHTITVSHGTGNILLDGAANKTLNSPNDALTLMWDGSNWIQIAFSNNG